MTALTSHSAIFKNTINVHRDDATGMFNVTFKFDSTYDCNISVYLCAYEKSDKTSVTLYPAGGSPPGQLFSFGPGKGQEFKEGKCLLDLNKYKEHLGTVTGGFFPLIIRIVFRIVIDLKIGLSNPRIRKDIAIVTPYILRVHSNF